MLRRQNVDIQCKHIKYDKKNVNFNLEQLTEKYYVSRPFDEWCLGHCSMSFNDKCCFYTYTACPSHRTLTTENNNNKQTNNNKN